MASGAVEKTADELRKEIQELQRQHREITDRLRDPRGIRRGATAPGGAGGVRPVGSGPRQRGFVRPAVESEEQQAPKRRLLSSLVVKKVEGEEVQEIVIGAKEGQQTAGETVAVDAEKREEKATEEHGNGMFRRDGTMRTRKMDYDMPPPEPLPRVFPKNEDPSLVKRNRRMLGQLLGTLEKFRAEDKQFSSTEAYLRRSDSLRRAEEKAREESERLRLQEREQIQEKRRRDLTLRARVAAKAEQKKLELLFILWAQHHKKLSSFLRTKSEPQIYYTPAKPLCDDATVLEKQKEQVFEEWKSGRRAELSEFQKKVEEQYLSNVEKQLERWQNARNSRNNNAATLQETMDQELEAHRLEHGPKPQRIPGGNDNDDDVDDIAAEDDLDLGMELNEPVVADSTGKLPDGDSGDQAPDVAQ